MQIRFIKIDEDNEENNKVISIYEPEENDKLNEIFQTLCTIKELTNKDVFNDVGIELNTKDIVDKDGDWYEIKYISFVIPKIGGQILPYIAVYINDYC